MRQIVSRQEGSCRRGAARRSRSSSTATRESTPVDRVGVGPWRPDAVSRQPSEGFLPVLRGRCGSFRRLRRVPLDVNLGRRALSCVQATTATTIAASTSFPATGSCAAAVCRLGKSMNEQCNALIQMRRGRALSRR